MTSSGFALAETARKDPCIKCLLLILVLIFASLLVIFTITLFKDSPKDELNEACKSPKLEENSLTNWSIGAEKIAFTCFPDYFLDEGSKIAFSSCKNEQWEPPPPSCNILPLFLQCEVKRDGFKGVVQLWQNTTKESAEVVGMIDYSGARAKGHENISVQIGKKFCNSSTLYEKLDETLYNSTHLLSIKFKSSQIVAYKGAELKATIVFINETSTVKVVYLKQENVTLIMETPLLKVNN